MYRAYCIGFRYDTMPISAADQAPTVSPVLEDEEEIKGAAGASGGELSRCGSMKPYPSSNNQLLLSLTAFTNARLSRQRFVPIGSRYQTLAKHCDICIMPGSIVQLISEGFVSLIRPTKT
ncbi:hypothetical protein EYZ11_008082 [Aspergillus tanneri]|uniref:Uncharacterized protein n=1 Tax=Aspergillus tanneri TaxID=1220188 RepID=A0A4S3JBJ0_9EURO|nr:hypothetical protein EYZ11_008082 [Aspergillus tanneri]